MAKKKTPAKRKVVKQVAKKKPTKKAKATKKAAVAKAGKNPTKKKPNKKKTKGVDLECFLTTACVHYYQLPDNAYELTTLRRYRDTYLLNADGGKQLVKEYYKVAPELVQSIEKDRYRAAVYKFIYTKIKKACSEIEQEAYLAAKKTYKNLVKTLQKKYQPAKVN